MAYKEKLKNQGFTLVEIVVVIFVTSILLLGFFSLYEWHTKIYNYQQAVIRVSNSSRQSLQLISNYVSQGYRVLASGNGYNTGSSNLVLQLPSIDSSGDVVSGKWDTVVFYTGGSNLFIMVDPDPSSQRVGMNKLLSDTIVSLTFTYNNANYDLMTKVSVDMTNRVTLRNQSVTNRETGNFYLKNYY